MTLMTLTTLKHLNNFTEIDFVSFFSLQNTFFNQLQQSANPKKKKSKYIFSAFFLCKNNQSYKSYKRNSVFKKTKIDLIS